ncbi:MAG TPA: hypothetical protein OQH54_03765 [Nitrosopumilus sp.]|nr:hypothetical protein [Thermoproteota archaeon]HJJ22817.1 hypothetical protein [Nitrosopumilus sp.]
MQKSGTIIVVSGTLIAVGLVLLVLGNQIILEGVSQGNEKISLDQTLTILADFDSQDTSIGVFAVQIMKFKDNTFSAKVLDSSDIEIISQPIDEESIEKEFDVLETGTYKLIVESTSNEEILVFAAIGPLPDTGKKSLGFISMYVLVIGMAGLVIGAIYVIKNRKSV